MATVLIRHPVEDYAKWKDAFDDVIDYRKAGGEKSYRICRPIDEPNNLVILFEWDNLDNAQALRGRRKSHLWKLRLRAAPD